MRFFRGKNLARKKAISSRIAIKTNYVFDESSPTIVSEYLLREAGKKECNLYGIVDSARNDEVFRFFLNGEFNYKSLFEETKDLQLYGVSGFLVECKKESQLFNWMTTKAWGNCSCLFLITKVSFDEILAHFQQFNRVYLEDDEEVFFRFYDPRVLRAYLPTCTKTELDIFFGKVENFIFEDKDYNVLNAFKKTLTEEEFVLTISKVKIAL